MVKFPLGDGPNFPAGNLTDRYQLSSTPDLRASTTLVVRAVLSWSNGSLTVGDENSAFIHLESSINTWILSYLLNFCETTIPCLLKSRQRFELNDIDLTTICKLCASYQAICWNRLLKCLIFISLIACKYDMTSCPVSFTTYLDRHPGK